MTADAVMVEPLSMTHRHLLSCVNTVLKMSVASKVTRILDVGCGDGLLIKYLAQSFSVSHPGREIEVFGMDVHDHGVQAPGYWAKTLSLLSGTFPPIDWRQRLQLVAIAEPWPYPDLYFDAVVSNRVLEHAGDHLHFFQGRRETAIAMATRLGFGKFAGPGHERSSYAAAQSEYLEHQVNYQTQHGIAAVAAAAGLAPSFARTYFYYLQKLRSIMGRPTVKIYPPSGTPAANVLARLLRYVSSVTLELRPSGESVARSVPAAIRQQVDA